MKRCLHHDMTQFDTPGTYYVRPKGRITTVRPIGEHLIVKVKQGAIVILEQFISDQRLVMRTDDQRVAEQFCDQWIADFQYPD